MNAVLQEPLADRFRERDTPYLSPAKVGDLFGYRVHELAERAHVHRNTPTARPHAQPLQRYLRDMVRVRHESSHSLLTRSMLLRRMIQMTRSIRIYKKEQLKRV